MDALLTAAYGFGGVLIILLTVIFFVSGCSVVRTDISTTGYKKGMVYYYLPQTLVKINVTSKVATYYNSKSEILSSSIVEQNFAITTENIADTKELLTLNYKPNIFMSDELKYQVNEKGLLESIKVTTKDETAAIIETITNAPEQIIGRGGIEEEEEDNNYTLIVNEYTRDFHVKISEISNAQKDFEWNIIVLNEQGGNGYKDVDASFSLKLDTTFQTDSTIKEISSVDTTYIDGIITRPISNVTLIVNTAKEKTQETVLRVIDPEKLVYIPIKRTAFVKRENEITIQDGLIKSNEITNPSSVNGFISIPINIAKAIVSIPGQIITFKYDNKVNQKKLEEAEKNLLDMQQQLKELKELKEEINKTNNNQSQ